MKRDKEIFLKTTVRKKIWSSYEIFHNSMYFLFVSLLTFVKYPDNPNSSPLFPIL
jgi:hypothetical protein